MALQTLDKSASLLSPIGYQNSSCGYCNNKSGSQSNNAPKRFSYYASTTLLQPEFYQSLLNRGWRRSGTLLYKPNQRASCCPQYTIRLDADSFHTSKDQRQVLNRFTRHILGDVYSKDAARLYNKARDQAKKRNTEFDLLDRVHECEKENLQVPPEPAHSLVVTLEPDNFTEEKYLLFENYQRNVHQEPPHKISKNGFKNFLCSSPLPRKKQSFEGRERLLGSYHQCYRIDGKLVAIGVLDLLPQCVSAVYFMYYESVHQHGFGKLGALREIALAKEEGYKWWYAGFYIHNCTKLRYKGDYRPQFILDPESYSWDPLDDDMKKLLDAHKYISLSQQHAEAEIPKAGTETVISSAEEETITEDDSDEDTPDMPLFTRSFPGLLTRDQLLHDADLDRIKLVVRGQEAETCDLLDWDTADIEDPGSIKGIIAELVAAVGVELSNEMTVKFG